jgi:hypothetical protein
MHLIDVLAEIPAGLYVLTANGELGIYDAQRQLHIDEPLSRAFAEHNRDFLRAHLQDPLADDRRVAILFDSLEPNAWGHLTLSLETRGAFIPPANARLWAHRFQKKPNLSVYRGMELLLDYRHERKPDEPVYCPVLFLSAQHTLRAHLGHRAQTTRAGT